jgi:hypothetical protein
MNARSVNAFVTWPHRTEEALHLPLKHLILHNVLHTFEINLVCNPIALEEMTQINKSFQHEEWRLLGCYAVWLL